MNTQFYTQVICNNCGKKLYKPNWQVRNSRVFYCNSTCQFPKVEITCTYCKKQKRVSPSAVKSHNFCSRKCQGKWRTENNISTWSTRKEVQCRTCGKIFLRQPNQIKQSNNQYCSKECFYIAHAANMEGDKNPAWRGGYDPYYGPNWDRQSYEARKRDNFTCQDCGINESNLPKKLHVHHIVPLRAFKRNFKKANALSNLISLCSSCHKAREWKSI